MGINAKITILIILIGLLMKMKYKTMKSDMEQAKQWEGTK